MRCVPVASDCQASTPADLRRSLLSKHGLRAVPKCESQTVPGQAGAWKGEPFRRGPAAPSGGGGNLQSSPSHTVKSEVVSSEQMSRSKQKTHARRRPSRAKRLPKGATRLAGGILPPSDEEVRRIKWLKEFLAGLDRKAGLNGGEARADHAPAGKRKVARKTTNRV
jgi:hypothetical protein